MKKHSKKSFLNNIAQQVRLYVKQNKSFLLGLTVIVILGAIPRAIELINHNYLFGFDQGWYFQDVKQIVIDHKLTLIGTEVGRGGGLFQGPGWIYLLAIPFFLSRGDPYSVMILMFILGILAIILSAVIAKRMFDTRTGLLVGFLIAISPAIISQSRFFWGPFPITVFMPLFTFAMYQVLHKKPLYLAAATFIVGIISHFEIAVAGIMIIKILLLLPFLLVKKFVSFWSILVSGITFFITQITLVIFDLRHNHIILKGVYSLWFNPSETRSEAGFLEEYAHYWRVYASNFFSSFQASKQIGLLILVFMLIGSFLYLRDKKIAYGKKY